MWTNQSWVFYHDNAPAHSSFLVRNFLAKNETTVVPQPPYPPDLGPADFFLFPKLKSTLKGRCFYTFDKIQEKTEEGVVRYSERSVQKLAETLGAVCC
jgi:transposase